MATLALLFVAALCAKPLISYATASFSLSDPSNYTFDNSKIEFLSGQAQLEATTTSGWYNPSWKYRKEITIDHTKVSGDLTNFSVLISRTDLDWRNTANGGSIGKPDGTDLVFTAADGVTPLNYEIENYASTTGKLVAWVKIPSLSSATDTNVYAYYGNASAVDQQNTAGVWDANYQAVLHLGDGPVTSIAGNKDSSSYMNGGVPTNFNNTASSTTNGIGEIGNADIFDGINDFVITRGIPVSAAGNMQEGLATDGSHIFVASEDTLFKYVPDGTLLTTSSAITDHFGGMTYLNGYLYVSESACPVSGTSANQHIYKYDAVTLQKVAEYDISSDFTVCAGAIAYYNNAFYVAESYYDSTHNDYIVQYDTSFNRLATYTLNHQCNFGIQGIEYLPPLNKFRLLCHDTAYLDVDTSFSNGSIALGTSPIFLQDLAYLGGTTVLYNNRAGQLVRVYSDPNLALRNFNDTEYTAQAWFRIDGGTGTRRAIFESSPTYWSISAEVNASNLLAYSVQTTGASVTKTTNITPTTSVWHSLSVVYKANSYSKVYYDGSELTTYAGSPTGNLAGPVLDLVIGTYRNADARYFNGGIDEVRVSNLARSPAWITTEFNNENVPSSFYSSIGSQAVPYSTDNPTVRPTSPTSFTFLAGFSETAVKNGGEIQYQLSNNDGTSWYWYNSGWVPTTSGYAESNTAALINTNIATFPLGSGQFLWRAYLHSDGTQLVQLSNITLAYLNDTTPPVITLNGASTVTLTVGQAFSDPGTSATDDIDNSVSVVMGGDSVNTATPGTYYITYDAVDNAGNHAVQVTRTVIVQLAGGGGVVSGPLAIGYQVGASVTPAVVATVSSISSVISSQPISSTGSTFIRNRQLRDIGGDIRLLQQYLNVHGFTLASTGPGSPGNETSVFGTLTYKALVKFQLAHNFPGTGFLGPLTRVVLNTIPTSD